MPKPAVMTAAEIKDLRESLGMTQEELARELGLSSAITVSRWERGLHPPSRLANTQLQNLARKAARKQVREGLE